MPLYLTVSEGPSADEAEPLFATKDPMIIARVAEQLAARCGVQSRRQVVPLNSKPQATREAPTDDSCPKGD